MLSIVYLYAYCPKGKHMDTSCHDWKILIVFVFIFSCGKQLYRWIYLFIHPSICVWVCLFVPLSVSITF